MPFYQYRCDSCKRMFEIFSKTMSHKERLTCPFCGSNNVKMKFSSFFVPKSMNTGNGKPESFSGCEGCCSNNCPMR